MRNIDELIAKKPKDKPVEQMTAEELTRAAYLADLARLKDMTPDADKVGWHKPVRPLWRN